MTALAHERPKTMPETRTESVPPAENGPDLDEVVWQAWKAMELPEGYRAEIIEGAIEVSPTGRYSHGQIINLLRDDLAVFLKDGDFVARNDMNVIHEGSAWVPDLFVIPRDTDRYVTADGLGVTAAAVRLVIEVASPGKRSQDRDRVKKRREYARAGIPVYVIIDDHDTQGTVTVLTQPQPEKADWVGVHRVPYGTDVTIPEGPAKGFVIGEAITGPKRS
ncbi:Uma2 family endonuclease [Streptomyces sp. NBC_01728]|uniref:Uma2 family endonuclease n=1 Tax=unclassified Streptomyces TaxID=2593676 RepID=UPI002257C704|nr:MULTISPECIES: Uma2 family endonuclease [unclassified Streptomyces]MCX4455660.1 Uma2 family endonuclease [Streptomyces sp. NBC_01719]MCX4495020.1 Uma2 family endonuclease [Streptomyces sp. NBC_01728]